MDTSIIVNAATLHEVTENSIKAYTTTIEKEEVEPFLKNLMPRMLEDAKEGRKEYKTQIWIKDDRKREFFQQIVEQLLKDAGYEVELCVPKNNGYVYVTVSW